MVRCFRLVVNVALCAILWKTNRIEVPSCPVVAVNIQERYFSWFYLTYLFHSFVGSLMDSDAVLSNKAQSRKSEGFWQAFFVQGVRITVTVSYLSGGDPLLIKRKNRITRETDYQTEGIDYYSAVNNGVHNIQLHLIKNRFTKTLTFYFMVTDCLFTQKGFKVTVQKTVHVSSIKKTFTS